MNAIAPEQRLELSEHRLTGPARWAVAAMSTGLALTVGAMVALAIALGSNDFLAQHLNDVYAGYVEPPDEAAVVAYLFTLGALAVGGWLWMLWAVYMRKRWTPLVATIIFVLATAFAVANLAVTEYGQTILPTEIGVGSLLLCLAGLAAVVLLWRREPTRERS